MIYLNSDIAHRIAPSQWTVKFGRDIKGFHHQTTGNNCGIYILMNALSLSTDAPFWCTERDMAHIRKWWCINLMERFQIDGHGQRFGYWTNEATALLQGSLQPIYRIPKSRKRNHEADDVFLKDTIEAAAWCQLQSFTDHVSLPMVIGMEGAEQQAALAELKSVDRSCPEESPNRIEPFQFVFNSKDYEMFCVEMFDRRKLKVFASWE
ncbi:uncharacterized protein LOC115543565 [Gadus morhua]|uniref:uncharacterized protein LOC115543565 n=1 Tax=Gadus morhua TaxID=8049 RepID=UPI0011B550EF|nr:uncharacterized protein LOC115543565 [Gadus morhua]